MAINEAIGTDKGEVFSFTRADSDFDFGSKRSEVEQGPCWTALMSPADELFHDGKIRPLQPIAQLQAISFFDEQPVTARVDVLEDFGFQSTRSEKNFANLLAPGTPVPSTLTIAIQQAPPRQENRFRRAYQNFPLASELQHQGKARGKQKANRDINPTTILRRVVAPQPAFNVFYRRSQSMSQAGRVLHTDDEASCTRETKGARKNRKFTESEGDSAPELQQQILDRKGSRRTLKELFVIDNSRRQSTELLIRKPNQVTDQRGSILPAGSEGRYRNHTWPERYSKAWINGASPHERHYAAQRAEVESMKKKTSLPYRQGILGCLRFRSKSLRSDRYY